MTLISILAPMMRTSYVMHPITDLSPSMSYIESRLGVLGYVGVTDLVKLRKVDRVDC